MAYIPDRGDLVWMQMNPQAGREQAGHRPAFIVSPKTYNGKVGLALICPLTTKAKGYPFEVPIQGQTIQGVILADQVKSLDWKARRARLVEKADDAVVSEVLAKIEVLIRD
ncbi:MAG: endoribonuclease MazF [Lentisphaerae bacterium]|jgi:mRNA interferase MazF|nr:endoribonuclease MazF [Lentisphaerota bacterium]